MTPEGGPKNEASVHAYSTGQQLRDEVLRKHGSLQNSKLGFDSRQPCEAWFATPEFFDNVNHPKS